MKKRKQLLSKYITISYRKLLLQFTVNVKSVTRSRKNFTSISGNTRTIIFQVNNYSEDTARFLIYSSEKNIN